MAGHFPDGHFPVGHFPTEHFSVYGSGIPPFIIGSTLAGGEVDIRGKIAGWVRGFLRLDSGTISPGNSSTDTLLANATFTGAWEDVTHVAVFYVNVEADVASATDGLKIQTSIDGTNVFDERTFTVPANTPKTYSFQASTQYVRVVYVNGGTNQTSFILATKFLSVFGKSPLTIDGVDYKEGNSGIDASTETLTTTDQEHHEAHANSHYFIEDYIELGSAEVKDFCIQTDDSDKWVHLVFKYKSDLLLTLNMYENTDFDADGTLITQFGNNRAKCFSGTHTAATSVTIMTDSTAAFTVDALIGWKIYNITDGSYGIVTDNDATTVTVASLTGGTDNDWDTTDQYEINRSLMIATTGNTINSVGIRLGGSKGGSGTNPSRGQAGGQTRSEEKILRPNTKHLFRFLSGAAANTLTYASEHYEHTDKN